MDRVEPRLRIILRSSCNMGRSNCFLGKVNVRIYMLPWLYEINANIFNYILCPGFFVQFQKKLVMSVRNLTLVDLMSGMEIQSGKK